MDMTCQLLVHFINLSFESFMIVCLWKLSHWSLVIHLLSVIDDNKKMIYQERVYRSCECTLFFQPKVILSFALSFKSFMLYYFALY